MLFIGTLHACVSSCEFCSNWRCSWLLFSPIGSEFPAHAEAAQWLKTQLAVYSSKNSAFHLPQAKAITPNTLPSLQMIIWLPAFFVNVTLMAPVPFIRLLSSHVGLLWASTASPCPPSLASGVSWKKDPAVFIHVLQEESALQVLLSYFRDKCSFSRHTW